MEVAVGPAFRSKIYTDDTLKAQADDPGGPTTRYYAIASSVKPFDNVHCRRAVFYALNKAAALQIAGGSAAGAVAQSATPPGIPGYDPSYDPYPNGKDHTGDLTAAKKELTECGQPERVLDEVRLLDARRHQRQGLPEREGLARPRRHQGHGRDHVR